eukprot:SAG11_NODE_1952_length_4011_cov_3.936605_5_plen_63_part_00
MKRGEAVILEVLTYNSAKLKLEKETSARARELDLSRGFKSYVKRSDYPAVLRDGPQWLTILD